MAPLRIIANSWVANPRKPVAGRGRKLPAARTNKALQVVRGQSSPVWWPWTG